MMSQASSGALICACEEIDLLGDASFTADFGARTVNGSFTNVWAGMSGAWQGGEPVHWNDVAFNSTISGNAFGGVTAVTSAPPGSLSLSAGAAGTIEGRFFGPSAQEAGAVWTLFDGTRAAIGTLSGSRQ